MLVYVIYYINMYLLQYIKLARSSKRNSKTGQLLTSCPVLLLAERVGFEPTVGCPITSFQDWLLKPLGHLSIAVNIPFGVRKVKELFIKRE